MPYDPYVWLDARYAAALNGNAGLPAAIDVSLQQLSQGMNAAPVNVVYNGATYQLAYALSHLPPGVRMVERKLGWNSRDGFPWAYTIFGGTLDIVSLGCGPGSDLVGALMALKAVPRRIRLHAADREAAWQPLVDAAVDSVLAQDALLQAAVELPVSFQVLDLSDAAQTEAYLDRYELRHATRAVLILLNRVLDALPTPRMLMDKLIEFAPTEALLQVAVAEGSLNVLTEFRGLLDAGQRRGACIRDPEARVIENVGWQLPAGLAALNLGLQHKLQFRAEYASLVYLMDSARTVVQLTPAAVEEQA